MTTLLLARHGETDWNRELRIQGSSDIELNELGRQQAQFLAQELTDVELDAIYSSDLSRPPSLPHTVSTCGSIRGCASAPSAAGKG
jgi:broad specificity phosphatase PhoE